MCNVGVESIHAMLHMIRICKTCTHVLFFAYKCVGVSVQLVHVHVSTGKVILKETQTCYLSDL